MKIAELLTEKKIIPANASLDYLINYAKKEAEENGKDFSLSDAEDRLKALIPMLENNCSVIIDAYKKNKGEHLLLRGIRKQDLEFASKILDKREPGYLNKPLHDLVNEAMTKMGLEAHRGNSAFCSTDPEIASSWGSNVFIVFPKDGFKFTTFEKVGKGTYFYDRLDHRWDFNQQTQDEKGGKLRTETRAEQIDRMIKEILKPLKPQNKDIAKWLPLSHEYMISGEGFIALQESFYRRVVRNWLKGK